MTSHGSSRTLRSPARASLARIRALLALCALGITYLLGNAGCSSGDVCFRNTDCPYASDCKHGYCVRRSESVAGGSSVDTGAAGESDMSQTPDAN
jgi:hypothetical protein